LSGENKLGKKFDKVFDRILDVTAWVAGSLIIVMMLLVSGSILLRMLGDPQGWITEINEDLLLYITFLVSAWVLKEGRHVSMDFLINRLNEHQQNLANMLLAIAGAILGLLVAVIGTRLTIDLYLTGYTTVTVLSLPKAAILWPLPFGCILLAIESLREAICFRNAWKGRQVETVKHGLTGTVITAADIEKGEG
jgi:TRAP-type C4-dicarboxylate transport system permease small subunit